MEVIEMLSEEFKKKDDKIKSLQEANEKLNEQLKQEKLNVRKLETDIVQLNQWKEKLGKFLGDT